ncbi:MAG: hypothetical protein LW869_06345 [Actinobacteria bacterium]|nr:hypothetical protein [Actinomycetota bacterium]
MKKQPIIQYEISSETGGVGLFGTMYQPTSMRKGLLIDSVRTSRYGTSFVRIGGML